MSGAKTLASVPRGGMHGYTTGQLVEVLEAIAGRARTLEVMLSDLAECTIKSHAGRDMQVSVDVALIVINAIGGMADDAIGGAVVGDWKEWTYGPTFTSAGKAVTS